MGEADLTPVTEHTKDRIWEEMWDVARYVQYYEMNTNRLSCWSKSVRFASLLGAAGAVSVALNDAVPTWIGVFGAISLLVLTAVDLIWDWGTRAALSHAISLECCVIEKDYEILWSQVKTNSIGESESQAKVNQLAMRIIAATSQLTETDKSLNRKAQEAATKVLAQRWGAAIDDTASSTASSS